MLERIIRMRMNACQQRSCPHVAELDFADPCAACPEGHWFVYDDTDCKRHAKIIRESVNPLARPGHVFSHVINKITGKAPSACGRCSARIFMMNKWGWWECWKKRKIITGWLVEEAEKRGHKVGEHEVLGLLKSAIYEVRNRTA